MAKQWAVVTGASSGLGKEFAKVLAARNINSRSSGPPCRADGATRG